MSDEKKSKAECMDAIRQGVFIVGTRRNETYNFMTAAFVTQVSFDPCSIALSVDRSHYTAELIEKQGAFSLSVLAEGQVTEAKACGYQTGRKYDKAERVDYYVTDEDLPVVKGAAAYLICKVKQAVLYEDHEVFFAGIISADRTDATPMLYRSKEFFP